MHYTHQTEPVLWFLLFYRRHSAGLGNAAEAQTVFRLKFVGMSLSAKHCRVISNKRINLHLQVIVSGKLRAQRAKSMKFKDGYMISSGSPVNDYIDSAVRHVMLRQVCTQTSSCRKRLEQFFTTSFCTLGTE